MSATIMRSISRVQSAAIMRRTAQVMRQYSSLASIAATSHHSAASSILAHPRNCACPTHAPVTVTANSIVSPASPAFSLVDFIASAPAIATATAPLATPADSLIPADAIILPFIKEEIECAVPKRRTSISRQRHRRAGDRLRNRRRVYQNYRICFVCGTPVVQHHICTKCMHIPTHQ